jgi:hypothetical protein
MQEQIIPYLHLFSFYSKVAYSVNRMINLTQERMLPRDALVFAFFLVNPISCELVNGSRIALVKTNFFLTKVAL